MENYPEVGRYDFIATEILKPLAITTIIFMEVIFIFLAVFQC